MSYPAHQATQGRSYYGQRTRPQNDRDLYIWLGREQQRQLRIINNDRGMYRSSMAAINRATHYLERLRLARLAMVASGRVPRNWAARH